MEARVLAVIRATGVVPRTREQKKARVRMKFKLGRLGPGRATGLDTSIRVQDWRALKREGHAVRVTAVEKRTEEARGAGTPTYNTNEEPPGRARTSLNAASGFTCAGTHHIGRGDDASGQGDGDERGRRDYIEVSVRSGTPHDAETAQLRARPVATPDHPCEQLYRGTRARLDDSDEGRRRAQTSPSTHKHEHEHEHEHEHARAYADEQGRMDGSGERAKGRRWTTGSAVEGDELESLLDYVASLRKEPLGDSRSSRSDSSSSIRLSLHDSSSSVRSASRGRERYQSSGRGGVGNIRRKSKDSVPPTSPTSTTVPSDQENTNVVRGREPSVDPDRIRSTGRGGVGNIKSGTRARQVAKMPARELLPQTASLMTGQLEAEAEYVRLVLQASEEAAKAGKVRPSPSCLLVVCLTTPFDRLSIAPPDRFPTRLDSARWHPPQHSSGRGGMGNIKSARSRSSGPKVPKALRFRYSTGRGGAGNVHHPTPADQALFDEFARDEAERARATAAEEGVHTVGRGGLANLTALPPRAPTPPPENPLGPASTGRGGAGNIFRSRSRSKEHTAHSIGRIWKKVARRSRSHAAVRMHARDLGDDHSPRDYEQDTQPDPFPHAYALERASQDDYDAEYELDSASTRASVGSGQQRASIASSFASTSSTGATLNAPAYVDEDEHRGIGITDWRAETVIDAGPPDDKDRQE
ncbi:hypothetical protein AcV7_003643 [Taiwanofungus camphoratus]|nr:hypothetical protein AcV7_003643 [Antrodia cinnamomea]